MICAKKGLLSQFGSEGPSTVELNREDGLVVRAAASCECEVELVQTYTSNRC